MNKAGGSYSNGSVLVVDDHASARESVCDVLAQAGHQVRGLASAVEALELLKSEPIEVVITDLQMPGLDGLEFIRTMAQRRIPAQAIMITAHATISSAVEAMRYGAFDYLEKPFNIEELEQTVAGAIARRRLVTVEDESLDDSTTPRESGVGAMVGHSPAMELLRQRIARAAPTDETVLITGESGTGKELVAKALHASSRRSQGPLVSLNCPALSPQLAESELFGHRRGAFTGAEADRVGRFEMARSGTILLDEITEIDLPLQAKLLRVLQERVFEPVGASEPVDADVRVIAATNRDLREEVAAGRFREDLYFRLEVVPIHLPPLREREDDVLHLASHFLNRAAKRLKRERIELTDDARQLFVDYHWPGNVRELENLVTRACVLAGSNQIDAAQLRPWLQEPDGAQQHSGVDSPELPIGARLDEVEHQMIVGTLERYNGHRAKTAAALGISVRTLSGKLRSYGYAPREKNFGSLRDVNRQMSPVGSAESADRKDQQAA